MNFYRKTFCIAAAVTLTLLLCASTFAQGPADVAATTPPTTADASSNPPTPQPPSPQPQTSIAADDSDGWRGQIAIYGWFPGIHGTVGVLGHDAGIHVPFSDVFPALQGIIPTGGE